MRRMVNTLTLCRLGDDVLLLHTMDDRCTSVTSILVDVTNCDDAFCDAGLLRDVTSTTRHLPR